MQGQCVDHELKYMKNFFSWVLGVFYGKDFSLRARGLLLNSHGKYVSVSHHNILTGAAQREFNKKGKVSPEFLRKHWYVERKRWPFVSQAKIITSAIKHIQKQKEKKKKSKKPISRKR